MIIEQPAASQHEQAALERQVARFYRELAALPAAQRAAHLALRRDEHAAYIHRGLARLPAGFIGLDASRPWLLFWMAHSLALLQRPLPQQVCITDMRLQPSLHQMSPAIGHAARGSETPC